MNSLLGSSHMTNPTTPPVITVAAFYTALPGTTAEAIQAEFSSVTLHPPLELLRAAFDSAALAMPGCARAVLTDLYTPFPVNPGAPIYRFPLDPERLMESRFRTWQRFLQITRGHVLFIDPDVLFQASVETIFARPFDVALTYRQETHWPINAGVMAFHADRRERGVEFLEQCLQIYQERYASASAWGGDQDVLREIVRGANLARDDIFTCNAQGFEALLLPCAQYNYSSIDESMTAEYPSPAVLHFKGRRKTAMLPAWRRIQSRQAPPQPEPC